MGQLAGKIDAEARKASNVIPFSDLLIGITALHFGYAIGTRNERHFKMIPDLKIISLWLRSFSLSIDDRRRSSPSRVKFRRSPTSRLGLLRAAATKPPLRGKGSFSPACIGRRIGDHADGPRRKPASGDCRQRKGKLASGLSSCFCRHASGDSRG
jgi:hypothetical protein